MINIFEFQLVVVLSIVAAITVGGCFKTRTSGHVVPAVTDTTTLAGSADVDHTDSAVVPDTSTNADAIGATCPEQSFSNLSITPEITSEGYTSEFVVIEKHWDADQGCAAIVLSDTKAAGKTPWTLCLRSADKLEIPVARYETVIAYLNAEPLFGSQDLTVAIWTADGAYLRFFYFAGELYHLQKWDCGGKTPCVTADFVGTACPAVNDGCGLVSQPKVKVTKSGCAGFAETLFTNERVYHTQNTDDCATYPRGFVTVFGALNRETEECFDSLHQKLSVAYLATRTVSQCHCTSSQDCRAGQICDTERNRCVDHRCLSVKCASSSVCNPYTGACEAKDPTTLVPCKTSADCGVGQVCHRPFDDGYCRADICTTSTCDASHCSPLVGCFDECLADCDCYNSDNGDVCVAGKCKSMK